MGELRRGLPPPKTDREVWGDKIANEATAKAREVGYPPQGTYKVRFYPVENPIRTPTLEEEADLSERVIHSIQGCLLCLSNEEWAELKRREDERRA